MTTARMSLGAVLGTIATTAGAITSAAGTAAAAIGMLGTYIDRKVDEQSFYGHLTAATTQERILEELALETMERKLALVEATTKSPAHTELFDASLGELRKHALAWNTAKGKKIA